MEAVDTKNNFLKLNGVLCGKEELFIEETLKNIIKTFPECEIVIVMGSEGKGIRPLIIKACDDLLTIPMLGKLNSLNVSSAVSAVLFERHRQMLQANTN